MSAPVIVQQDASRSLESMLSGVNAALVRLQADFEKFRTETKYKVTMLEPWEGVTAAALPGAPWPLRLSGIPGGVRGCFLARAESMAVSDNGGATTSPVSLQAWSVDGGTLLIHYVTNLVAGNRYRLTFGVIHE